MTTWIVGDIHGCAHELGELVKRLALAPSDRLISVGDLFHRGPDPAGVMAILSATRARFVLGNHERAVLARCGRAPRNADASDRPDASTPLPDLEASDLLGDGNEPCRVEPQERAVLVRFLEQHSGYWLRSDQIESAGRTPDGRAFAIVHAGLEPGLALERNSIRALTSMRRTSARGNPWWYESYSGPELVLFGHTPSPLPRAWRADGKLVALGLDTGCVYGGKLTAYSPELDEFVVVRAQRAYAHAAT
jgi:diadenosine tetraphosphatase ApaH/serine/threonine PP2A family protein phosphatase